MLGLYVTTQFRKDLRKIPSEVVEQSDQLVRRLRQNPLDRALNVRKLKLDVTPLLWRVRIGQYRLVYSFDNTTITLHRVRHRKDVYRSL